MSATILHTIPFSGSYPEKHFGQNFNYQIWVEFEDNNFNKWLGCFPKHFPHPHFDKTFVDKNNNNAFVVIGGIGYLIDIANQTLLYQTEEYPAIESAMVTADPDFFIAGVMYSVYIFDKSGLFKEIKPDFFVDGIFFTGQKGKNAFGDLYSSVYQGFNVGFELNLETFEMKMNKEIKVRRTGPFEYVILKDTGKTSSSLIAKLRKWLATTLSH